MSHTLVVSNARVEIESRFHHLSLFVGDVSDQPVVVFDADVIGGTVEAHCDGVVKDVMREWTEDECVMRLIAL